MAAAHRRLVDQQHPTVRRWKERLRVVRYGTHGVGRLREDPNTVLMAVRAFYADLAVWALEDPGRWAMWAAPNPINGRDLLGQNKQRKRATAPHAPADPSPDVARIKVPQRLPRHLCRSHVAALLAACPNSRANLIILLQVQLGLRCCEVGALRLGGISFADRTVRVRGKGGRERLLPIDDETWLALAAYLRERPRRQGALICRRDRIRVQDISASRISEIVRAS